MSEQVKRLTGNLSLSSDWLKWGSAVLAAIIIFAIPSNGFYSGGVKSWLAVTAVAIILCGTGAIDGMWIGLFIPCALKALNVAEASTIYSGWLGTTPWVILGSLLLATLLEQSGLLNRIALFCIIKTGGTYKGICYGLLIACIVCSFLSSCNVQFMMAAFAFGICKTLKFECGDASAGITMAVTLGVSTIQGLIYYPGAWGLLLASIDDPSVSVSWIGNIWNCLPFIFLPFIIMWFLMKFVLKTPTLNEKETFQRQYEELGPITGSEKKSIVILLAMVIALVSSQWTGMDSSWPFLIGPLVFFLPGINIGSGETLKKTNIGMAFLVGGFIAIGACAGELGIGTFIANALMPLFQGKGIIMVVLITFVFGFLVNFGLTPFAMYTTFTGMLAQIYTTLGFGALGAAYVLLYSGDAIVFPYENLSYLVYFSFGIISMKNFTKLYSIKALITCIFTLVVMVPWWLLVGVL
jgi:di/tricarboxylate transporter